MNKEEILAMSRQENKDKDLYELEVNKKADGIGAIVGAIVCCILFAAETFICGNTNFGLWGLILAINAGSYIYKGIKLKKTSNIVVGVMSCCASLLMVGYTIYNLFAASTIL